MNNLLSSNLDIEEITDLVESYNNREETKIKGNENIFNVLKQTVQIGGFIVFLGTAPLAADAFIPFEQKENNLIIENIDAELTSISKTIEDTIELQKSFNNNIDDQYIDEDEKIYQEFLKDYMKIVKSFYKEQEQPFEYE